MPLSRVLSAVSLLLCLLQGCVLTSDTELNRPQSSDEGGTEPSDVQAETLDDILTDPIEDQHADTVLDMDLSAEDVEVAGDVDVDEGTTPTGYRVVYTRFSWPQGFSENGDGYRIRTNSFGFMVSSESPYENDQYRLRAVHFGN